MVLGTWGSHSHTALLVMLLWTPLSWTPLLHRDLVMRMLLLLALFLLRSPWRTRLRHFVFLLLLCGWWLLLSWGLAVLRATHLNVGQIKPLKHKKYKSLKKLVKNVGQPKVSP